jgi:hypothetical protein
MVAEWARGRIRRQPGVREATELPQMMVRVDRLPQGRSSSSFETEPLLVLFDGGVNRNGENAANQV